MLKKGIDVMTFDFLALYKNAVTTLLHYVIVGFSNMDRSVCIWHNTTLNVFLALFSKLQNEHNFMFSTQCL